MLLVCRVSKNLQQQQWSWKGHLFQQTMNQPKKTNSQIQKIVTKYFSYKIMESKNDNYGQGEQQLRKRKFNELGNDDQPATAGGEEQQHQPLENLSKKKCEYQQGNDEFENLNLESLTREELIQFTQKQLANQNEAHIKQLEAVKKEAEVSAKQQAEMTTKMEELNKALLANQNKVEELTGEMANQRNVEDQKHLDNAKQAEEFSQRIVQLEQEKAAVQEELSKKMLEIVEMHKEVKEKSEQLTEKAKQIDALLVQLNESTSNHHQKPTEQEMKIQLSLESWYDWLTFVPRHRLGQIIPMIGDRKFASIAQKFLHEYGEIKFGHMSIVAPYEEDPSGPHPRVRTWQNNRQPLRFEMAESKMPANIKNFTKIELSYFDQSVLTFMQKFQQNGLLDNVNLYIAKLSSKDILQSVLSHLLPLINGIVAIFVHSAQLVDIYHAENNKEIYEMNMKMMEKTRILGLGFLKYDPENVHPTKIDLYCRWLYQPARADGKPRVLVLYYRMDVDSAPISLFIDRIKQDFLMATNPVSFFIRIILPKACQLQENICLGNGKTKERLLTKIEEADPKLEKWKKISLLVSRYPLASTKKWIMENQTGLYEKIIYLSKDLKVVPI